MRNDKRTRTVATVRVKTDLEKPMDIDLIAEHIKAVSENFKKAMESGLQKRAIIILIHDMIPQKRVSLRDIEDVLYWAGQLSSYLKK